MKTITIAGGGLAGLGLALGLRRRGVPVALHEAGGYPRHRVCGEFISGVSEMTLVELGLLEALADARRQHHGRWFRAGCRLLDFEMPQAALSISRHRLDVRLRDALIASGGEVHEQSRLSREPREGQVWAAGRLPRPGQWIGLKMHYHGLPLEADLEMHLGGNGYAGLARVEDDRVNLCGLFRIDPSLKGRGPELLDRHLAAGGHSALLERLRGATPDPESFTGTGGFSLGWQYADPAGCPLGDAAALIPPFTGNGMTMAFESAALALDPLTRWSRGEIDWRKTTGEIATASRVRFSRRLAWSHRFHRILLHPLGAPALGLLGRCGPLPFRAALTLVR